MEATKPSVAKFWIVWNVIESLVILLTGAFSIFFGLRIVGSDIDIPFDLIVACTIGGYIILDAILRVVMSLVKFNMNDISLIIIAGFELTIGSVLILQYANFLTILTQLISIFLIVVGVLFFVFSIYFLVKKTTALYMPIVQILFGSILIALGVLILVVFYNGGEAREKVICTLLGAILCIVAISQIIMTIVNSKRNKKALKKASEEERKAAEKAAAEKAVNDYKAAQEAAEHNEKNSGKKTDKKEASKAIGMQEDITDESRLLEAEIIDDSKSLPLNK